jgi:chemotaxis protein CheX
MDVKLINPFITATLKVLETMASIKAVAGKPFLKKDSAACGDVSGIIGLTGAANGTLSVTFEEKSILKVVSNMFGETLDTVNEEVADAVGELTNMISGQARRELEQKGHLFHAAIPSVVSGKGHKLVHMTRGPRIAIPFSTDDGGFTIEVCMDR